MRKNHAVLTAISLALLLVGVRASHAEPMSPAKFRAMGIPAWEGNVIGTGRRPGELLLMGELTADTVSNLRQELASHPDIDTILIDSQGGHLRAALDIADIMRQRRLRLVVDGRCFSACAYYLFPAALSKTVLPGSLVGIHGKTLSVQEGGFIKDVPMSDSEIMLRSKGRPAESRKLEDLMAREARFYRDLKIDVSNHAVFQDYLQHRRQAVAVQGEQELRSSQSCPLVQLWVLDRAQWEAMGVRGIEQFWFPADRAAQQQVMRDLGADKQFFHFGSAASLEGYCAPSLRLRVMRWLASFSAGK